MIQSFFHKAEKNTSLALLALFALSFFFRAPALFNDYYDADELSALIQAREYLAGDVPGVDFKESKNPVYQLIFKAACAVSPDHGWVLVHVFTIVIIFMTAVFILFTGAALKDYRAGLTAAALYAVLISSFNRHFMATNGEIVYNLPVTAGLFFFIAYLSREKITRYLYLFAALAMGGLAWGVKFHGIILLVFIAFFIVFYDHYYTRKFTGTYVMVITAGAAVLMAGFLLDLMVLEKIAPSIIKKAAGLLFYSSAAGRKFSILDFLGRFAHRQGMLTLWHMVVWVPGIAAAGCFILNRFRASSKEDSAVFVLALFLYIAIFASGARLYFHYFMGVYPSLCIIASRTITAEKTVLPFFRKRLAALALVPGLFFFAWNVKDIAIKHLSPGAFYNEGKFLYWTRAVLTGSLDDYLLPHGSYKNAADYIKKTTRPGDRVLVWGDGPYLYYFSDRRPGIYHLWPKNRIHKIIGLYKKGTAESAALAGRLEENELRVIDRKKPELVIDTSSIGLTNFRAPLAEARLIYRYVMDHYVFETEIDKMTIYRRK